MDANHKIQYAHTTHPENNPLLFDQKKDIIRHKYKARISLGLISNIYNTIYQLAWVISFNDTFWLEKCAL